MKLRNVVLPSLVAAGLAAPAAAPAATLSVDKACYAPGDEVAFTGVGFTPNGRVALSVGGRQLGVGTVNPVGELEVGLGAPSIAGRTRTDLFTATDQTDLSLTADVPVRLTSLDVNVTPKNGNPARRKRVVARGFTAGRVLWAHVRRGKHRRNVRIGKLKGACKTLDVRRKLFPADARDGLYNVQFDTRRRYSKKTVPQVGFQVIVFHTFKPASASSVGGRWIRID